MVLVKNMHNMSIINKTNEFEENDEGINDQLIYCLFSL